MGYGNRSLPLLACLGLTAPVIHGGCASMGKPLDVHRKGMKNLTEEDYFVPKKPVDRHYWTKTQIGKEGEMNRLSVLLTGASWFSVYRICPGTWITRKWKAIPLGSFLVYVLLLPFSAHGASFLQPQIVSPLPTQVQPILKTYNVSPWATNYFTLLNANSLPGAGSGSLSGTISNPVAKSSDGDQLQWDWAKDFTIRVYNPGSLVGIGQDYYEITDTYSALINVNFETAGAVNYTYNVPFTASFALPSNVYSGQIVALAPYYTWNPSINGSSKYEYFTRFFAQFEGPGPSKLNTEFSQHSNKAYLGAAGDIGYGDPISFGNDITFYPFNMGGGMWPPEKGDEGSMTKLAGTDTVATSSSSANNYKSVQPTDLTVATWNCSGPNWKQADEHFNLAVYVSNFISPAVSAGIWAIKELGEFYLESGLGGNVCRMDTVIIQVSAPPILTVDPTLQIGTKWNFSNRPVNFKYRVQGCSSYSYDINYNVFFDMIKIDLKHPFKFDLSTIIAGHVCTDWQERTGTLTISGSIPVVPKDRIRPELMLTSSQLVNFLIPPPQKTILPPMPARSGYRVLLPQETRISSREKETLNVPRPTILTGIPAAGQFTTSLGTTSPATAGQIINALKAKGIPAFATPVPGSANSLVTLGSFANRSDAEILKMFTGAFGVDSKVTQTIDSKIYMPMKGDVLQKFSR